MLWKDYNTKVPTLNCARGKYESWVSKKASNIHVFPLKEITVMPKQNPRMKNCDTRISVKYSYLYLLVFYFFFN